MIYENTGNDADGVMYGIWRRISGVLFKKPTSNGDDLGFAQKRENSNHYFLWNESHLPRIRGRRGGVDDGSEKVGERTIRGSIENHQRGGRGKNSQWGLEQLEERVLKNKPDYVFIEFGMNDSYVPYACTLAQVEKQIDELTERILRSHPNLGICLMTMNPKIENAEKPVAPGRHNLLTEFYRLYQESSEKKKLDFIDHHGRWIQRERNEPGYLKKHIPDGVHPDGESAKEIVGGGVKEFLKEKLK